MANSRIVGSIGISRAPFVCAIVLSAFLLFNIEPLFGRMMLPLAGGSPAAWNMAMVCFQTLLLAGYLYAHLLQRHFPPALQLLVHVAVLSLAFFALPIHIDEQFASAHADQPYWNMIVVLTRGVGMPFFALSATGPLLQAWYALLQRGASENTYSLYAASNAGSLVGLLAYPLLLEPFSGIQSQTTLWAAGFISFFICLVVIAVMMGIRRDVRVPIVAEATVAAPTVLQRVRWIGFAAIPTSLMLAVTTGLTTFIAPIPLLWVFPLCLYLLTFILVFSESSIFHTAEAKRFMDFAFLLLVTIGACTVGLNVVLDTGAEICLLLSLFFVIAMRAHTIIYSERPAPARLTDFYLCLSFGSVIGGLFNALVAPLIFRNIYEFGIAIVAACLCFAPNAEKQQPVARKIALSVVLAAILIFLTMHLQSTTVPIRQLLGEATIGMSILAVLVFGLSDDRRYFTAAIAAIFVCGALWPTINGRAIYQSRNFFGVKTVTVGAKSDEHSLIHSGTVHGREIVSAAQRCNPLGYYSHPSPIGHFFESAKGQSVRSVAAVGLGAGALAAYVRPGSTWTFFEIDPVVRDIANNGALFHYMDICGHHPPVVVGDARLTLQKTGDTYDLMIFDAFTSDQIPVHIITREAMQIYLKHLRPGGVLAFHISNKFFNFEPVFANLAEDAHLIAMKQVLRTSPEAESKGYFSTKWVFLARESSSLESVRKIGVWKPLAPGGAIPLWTDDYSSLIRILHL